MDRDEILKAYNQFIFRRDVNLHIYDNILIDYFTETEQSKEILENVLQSTSAIVLFPILHDAFEYYGKKFNIIRIIKDGQIIKIY